MTGGQGVAGSNPAVPTQVRRLIQIPESAFWRAGDQDRMLRPILALLDRGSSESVPGMTLVDSGLTAPAGSGDVPGVLVDGAPAGQRQRRSAGGKTGSRAAIAMAVTRVRPRGCPGSRCGIVQGRPEPAKAVCCRRTTAPVELPAKRTHEEDLDRTCPAEMMAAIESRDERSRAGTQVTKVATDA